MVFCVHVHFLCFHVLLSCKHVHTIVILQEERVPLWNIKTSKKDELDNLSELVYWAPCFTLCLNIKRNSLMRE